MIWSSLSAPRTSQRPTVAKSMVSNNVPEIMDKLALFFENPDSDNLIFRASARETIKTTVKNAEQREFLLNVIDQAEKLWVDGLDSAPDADLFAVAALRVAAILWRDRPENKVFLAAAREMTIDMRKKYLAQIGDGHYLLGGDEFYKINGLNPSYSFEAVYDMLAELDPEGRAIWLDAKRTSMQTAILGADATLHRKNGTAVIGSSNLPPNWLTYDLGRYTDMQWFNFRDWFMGWDGARTLWMKSAYYLYNQNPIAKKYLTDSTGTVGDFGPAAFLRNEYRAKKMISSGFGIDGTQSSQEIMAERLTQPSPFTNGIYLGYFYGAGDQEMTLAMIQTLSSDYQAGNGTFKIFGRVYQDNYFSDHWAWFGLAMAGGMMEDYFSLYKADRENRGLPATEPENMALSEFSGTAATRLTKKTLNLSAWWAFDGCQKTAKSALACQGTTNNWYLGGGGGMVSGSASYSGVYINVSGTNGKVKIELYGRDGKLYIYELLAISAGNLYVPFGRFREQVNNQPAGQAFKPEIGVEKAQVIAIGESAVSPIDFTLTEFGLANQ